MATGHPGHEKVLVCPIRLLVQLQEMMSQDGGIGGDVIQDGDRNQNLHLNPNWTQKGLIIFLF